MGKNNLKKKCKEEKTIKIKAGINEIGKEIVTRTIKATNDLVKLRLPFVV